jgi:Domain of unknown function (DUF305)
LGRLSRDGKRPLSDTVSSCGQPSGVSNLLYRHFIPIDVGIPLAVSGDAVRLPAARTKDRGKRFARVDKRCKVKNWIWSIAILLALISAEGVLAQQHYGHQNLDKSMDSMVGEGDWPELMASMQKMDVDMASIKPTGDSDVDFVKLMFPHHQAAIDMAKTELMHGMDPQMRRLAQEIITDQQSEIELMQLWLKQHEPKNK